MIAQDEEPITYTVAFDANGGKGTMNAQNFTYDVAQALTDNAFYRKGYTFAGWNTQADGKGTAYDDKADGSKISTTSGATVTLYAQWTANTYYVSFDGTDADNGSMEPQTFTYDIPQALSKNAFTRTGYTFLGWCLHRDDDNITYTDEQAVSNLMEGANFTITLYAKWEQAIAFSNDYVRLAKGPTEYTQAVTKSSAQQGNVTYTSSNSNFQVDENGKVTFDANTTGTTTIRATLNSEDSNNEYYVTYTLTVNDYLCFTAKEAGSTIKFAEGLGSINCNIQTSTDGTNWSDYSIGDEIALSTAGDKVYFKGDYCGTNTAYNKFVMKGKIAASGNVMTLAGEDNPSMQMQNYAFNNLFNGCTALTSAPELPATTLAEGCYKSMFAGCTSLEKAPYLPAVTLEKDCYTNMFYGCSSLNYIKTNHAKWRYDDAPATNGWLSNVAANGTFISPVTLPTNLENKGGISYVPDNWDVKVSVILPANRKVRGFSYAYGDIDLTGLGHEVTAYYIKEINSSPRAIKTEGVPAETGVLLQKENGMSNKPTEWILPVRKNSMSEIKNNLLEPGIGMTVYDGYIWGSYYGEEAFYKIDPDEGFTVPEGYSYLNYANAYAKLNINFDGEDITLIETLEDNKPIVNTDVKYNLSGQKVGKDYKGIVIMNGKKVFKK